MTSDSRPPTRIVAPAKSVTATTMFVSWVEMPCDGPFAHAMPAEDLLDEHRAGEHADDSVREQRRHRYQSGSQAVFEQRSPSGQALGPRGADEVLPEHVEHGVALVAAVAGHRDQRQRHRRQDEVLEPVDELVPPATLRVSRRFPDVLEDLRAEREFTSQRRQDQQVAITNVGMDSTSSDSTVITRSLSRYCRIAPHAPSSDAGDRPPISDRIRPSAS